MNRLSWFTQIFGYGSQLWICKWYAYDKVEKQYRLDMTKSVFSLVPFEPGHGHSEDSLIFIAHDVVIFIGDSRDLFSFRWCCSWWRPFCGYVLRFGLLWTLVGFLKKRCFWRRSSTFLLNLFYVMKNGTTPKICLGDQSWWKTYGNFQFPH